jgi:predicted amino acid racemase
MSTPRLEIDLHKIGHNARTLAALYGSRGVSITAVTKGVCGSPIIARTLLNNGITSLGDSRVSNLRRLRKLGLDAQLMLIRSPSPSEVEQVVEVADVSLNSEISVVRRLAEHAARLGKVHKVILMIELGDLREGVLPEDVGRSVQAITGLDGVRLVGIGANLACFGGIAPTREKMDLLSSIAERVTTDHNLNLEIVSGGNSANYQWFMSNSDLGMVNHLRIGESILLGTDTLTRTPIPALFQDAFTLVAEVIESKVKPSQPYGTVAQDAFGHSPHFENRGSIPRAVLALGEQDVDVSALVPRQRVSILGASSDHVLLDASNCPLRVGDEVSFDLRYSALLRAVTSSYVEKLHLPSRPARVPSRARPGRKQPAVPVPMHRIGPSPTVPARADSQTHDVPGEKPGKTGPAAPLATPHEPT